VDNNDCVCRKSYLLKTNQLTCTLCDTAQVQVHSHTQVDIHLEFTRLQEFAHNI